MELGDEEETSWEALVIGMLEDDKSEVERDIDRCFRDFSSLLDEKARIESALEELREGDVN